MRDEEMPNREKISMTLEFSIAQQSYFLKPHDDLNRFVNHFYTMRSNNDSFRVIVDLIESIEELPSLEFISLHEEDEGYSVEGQLKMALNDILPIIQPKCKYFQYPKNVGNLALLSLTHLLLDLKLVDLNGEDKIASGLINYDEERISLDQINIQYLFRYL